MIQSSGGLVFQRRLAGTLCPHLNRNGAIVQLMQRFEDADKINASCAKRHVAELAGAVTGHWQRVLSGG